MTRIIQNTGKQNNKWNKREDSSRSTTRNGRGGKHSHAQRVGSGEFTSETIFGLIFLGLRMQPLHSSRSLLCYAMLSALNNCRRFAMLFVNFDSNCRFFYWSCWFSFWMLTHTWLAKTVERPSLFLLVYSRWDSSSDPRQPRTKSQCVNYRYSIIQEFYLSKKNYSQILKEQFPETNLIKKTNYANYFCCYNTVIHH